MAASSYLNTAPLIWSFVHGPRKEQVQLTDAVPSRCAELLAQGDVEAALVPVIEFQRLENVNLVPGVCIGSRQKVRSVVLASKKKNLNEVRSIALDESSRTSAALLKIMFREFMGVEPEWVTAAPSLKNMLQTSDAALIIGDPAMTFDRSELNVFDLANLWKNFTGKGFVFAMWMIRKDAGEACHKLDFGIVRDEGLSQTDQIVDTYHQQLGLPRAELNSYLRDNITFQVDSDLHDGLMLYYELAKKHGQIPQLKPLDYGKSFSAR